MQPNSEPTQADVAMVAAAMGGQPAPQPAPAPQMQPAAPTPQPSPASSQADPFAQLFTTPTEPTPAPAAPPAAPTEPVAPVAPVAQPTEPVAPAEPTPAAPAEPAPAAPPAEEPIQSYEDYMTSVLEGVPDAPASPDASKIDPEDPEAIKNFFDELVNTAVTKAEANIRRTQAIQTAEKQLWDKAFDKYASLRDNKKARDLVHNVRMGYFQRGQAITPTQAADILLESMGQQYRQGVADNQVVTTIESTQPNAGGSTTPVPTTLDRDNALLAVQTGGEAALTDILSQEIAAGRL